MYITFYGTAKPCLASEYLGLSHFLDYVSVTPGNGSKRVLSMGISSAYST